MERIGATASREATLEVAFVDEVHRIGPDRSLGFGRSSDIVVDDSAFLHPHVGRFSHLNGFWWLVNLMPRGLVRVRDAQTRSISILDGESAVALGFRRFVVEFTAGPTTYQLDGRLLGRVPAPSTGLAGVDNAPAGVGVATLTVEQRLLLAALAEPGLTRPPAVTLTVPPTPAVARRLGWSVPKVNRKLDYLCSKLRRQGVRNLKGGYDDRATDRRVALVQLALHMGWVSSEDLRLLEERP